MSTFHVKALSLYYGKHQVLSNVSFDINEGEIVGVLGINGCGKTSLLKAICNILPYDGICMLDDINLRQLSSRQFAKLCSYIPQRSGISIDISVLDTVLMGFYAHLTLLQHPTQAMKEKALEIIHLVGLQGLEKMNYLHLSEGQKQLCILARTLIAQSKLLLLDEPESALDFHHRYHMFHLLRQWNHKHHTMALVSLHDPNLALNYCDRLLLLSDGHIVDMIRPQVDSLSSMEVKLNQLYQNISLHECINKKGEKQIMMLGEPI